MTRDPYEYFRVEAREILEGLGRGALKLERGVTPGVLADLLRLAHTLKGAARVVRQPAIAEQAHEIEETLGPLRDGSAPLDRGRIDQMLSLVDAIAAEVTGLDSPAREKEEAHPREGAEGSLRTVRADVAEMDALLDGISEASLKLGVVRRAVSEVDRVRKRADLLVEALPALRRAQPEPFDGGSSKLRAMGEDLRTFTWGLERRLTGAVEQAEREMREVRDAAEKLRLMPASALFVPLERAARDAGRSLGKDVAFHARGGDIRLDVHVLGLVQSALVQLVRNAVAHGIEDRGERLSARKPPVGQIAMEVCRLGNRVTFTCRDDGRGVDLDAVRRAAQRKGLLPKSVERLDVGPLLEVLLRGGLTTSETVTEVSGRGIGLDVVREIATQLGGEVTVHTDAGLGTRFDLVVPMSLLSLDALLVEADGISAAIPLDAVRQTLRLKDKDIARSADGTSIVHQGEVIPFVPLEVPLRANATPRNRAGRRSAFVLQGATGLAAIGVDRLAGTANVVVRPLPAFAPAHAFVAGATLDAEGTPQIVLDPIGLVEAASHASRAAPVFETPPPAPVLIIDDSLTTRMLEQSILESAGYQVDLATSAEEGLEKARHRTYKLFLVDVEMPGMDGFSFVARTRADTALRQVPAILVTSRSAPADRQRGVDVGAQGYIVKGDFDQAELLALIRKLVR